ncbi:hypothetical protein [Chitinophaga arvensicola]|uniref:Uncharacterized protein n=1 Tax=Chitinophaga arvensicola TaxID=29529 RepID=A0A1I0NK27_9BACT|nr:hypothetical protein [Chitinophaga arvensicola]SEW01838.1 hypothetical protein SAMN04488122_0226 [Chitinophaga arvensicola]
MNKISRAFIALFFTSIAAKSQTLQNVYDNGNTINGNNRPIFLNRSANNFHFGIQWQTNNANDFFIGLREIGDKNLHIFNYGVAADAITIKRDNSYVGIGTMDPKYNLQVQKTSSLPAIMIGGAYSQSPRLQIYGLDSDPQAWMGLGTDMNNGPYEHSIYFPSVTSGRLTIGDYNGTSYNVRMSILNSGNVGIGTTNPQSKLAVAGTITAQRVKVTQTGWADYVFHNDYPLPPLSSVEKYVTTHQHLEGIPSAAEVEKEGIDVGEMNKKLLAKIEELTLYLIGQDKKITALEEWKSKQEKK